MSSNTRLLFLDIAKVICIVLVVIGHYMPEGCPVWWSYINKIIYSFHMPLFMFASGFIYIATKKNIPYFKFLHKKFRRLMIPYLAISAMIITIKLLSQGQAYVQNPVTVMSYGRMFYLPEAGYFLWFIWALWWMFVLVPFFRKKEYRLLLFVVSLIIHYLPISITDYFCFNQYKNFLVYFMSGIIVFDYKKSFIFLKKIPAILYFISFIIVESLTLLDVSKYTLLCQIANLVIPFFGISFIISLSNQIEDGLCKDYQGRILIISGSTYIIYLLHTTFMGVAKALVHKLPFMTDYSNDIIFTFGASFVVACGLLVPILLYEFFIKKNNTARFVFGLKPIVKNE